MANAQPPNCIFVLSHKDSSFSTSFFTYTESFFILLIESRRDCVVIVKDTAGNVINTAQWHYRDTNKELSHSKETVDSTAYFRSVIDSLRRIKQDSVYISKEVEKELSLWDRTKINFGGLAFVIIAATIIYLTWFIKRKDKQNI